MWADVAQLAEQGFCKPQVAGSSPIVGSNLFFDRSNYRGGMPEWLKGADCKSVANGYVGSNPTLPTIMLMQSGFSCGAGYSIPPHKNIAGQKSAHVAQG